MTTMRKSRVWEATLLTIIICLFSIPAYAKYNGGRGVPDDPYQIATAEDLMLLGETPEDYDKHFILTADIDLAPNLPGGRVFDRAVIAPDLDGEGVLIWDPSFFGVFDGKGHTISHLTVEGTDHLGLFGQLAYGGQIRNLGLVDVQITCSGQYTGGLVGHNYGGDVIHCYSTGLVGVVGEHDVVGKLIGYCIGGLVGVNNGWVSDCYSSTVVSGIDSVGGLVGQDHRGVTQCYSTGSVSGDRYVGGLVGLGFGQVSYSYNTGIVDGNEFVGGLMGCNVLSVVKCYSTGIVDGNESVGGLVGDNHEGVVTQSYNVSVVNSTSVVGLHTYCWIEMTTAEMMDPYMLGLNGFANDPNWVLDPGRDYPRFAWEGKPGQMIPDPNISWLKGNGGPKDPYQIDLAEELILLSKATIFWDKHLILGDNIDLDPNLPGRKVFSQAVIPVFTGVFDGNDHTISHLTVRDAVEVGLFGELRYGSEVRDLGLVDVNVTGVWGGGLVAYNKGGVDQCYSTGLVRGDLQVGGLVGWNGGKVINCCSASAVSGRSYVGGLVGWNPGSVMNSYSTGTVSGIDEVGGLVGVNFSNVVKCFSTGVVDTDSDSAGGLIGSMSGNRVYVDQCFWDTQTSGQPPQMPWSAGTGKTTAEMQMASTFLDAGWDFVGEMDNGTEDIWWIEEGKDYPRLYWQRKEPETKGMVFVFVDIPAGTFQMGDHDGVGLDDERPVHMVTLDGFQMSKYETTNAQYVEYLNAAMARGLIRVVNDVVYASSDVGLAEPYCDTHGSSTYSQIVYRRDLFAVGSRHGKDMSDHPVVRVNWYGAKAFCDYYGFRLPTEAEWEYAAQGGYQDPYYSYPWGSETIDCSKANFQSDSGYCNPLDLSVPFTSLVGYYGPHGAYGLCDMSGNVWEWCQDWYNDSYYSVSPVNNPTGPIMGSYRVLRGGSCSSESNDCRVANRRVYVPYSRNSFDGVFGFRVCR